MPHNVPHNLCKPRVLKSGSSQSRPNRMRQPKQRQLADFTADELQNAIIKLLTRVSRIACGLDEATQRKALEFKYILQEDVVLEKVPVHRKNQEKNAAPAKAPFVGMFDVVKDELCKVMKKRSSAHQIPGTELQPVEEKDNSNHNLIRAPSLAETAPSDFSNRSSANEDESVAGMSCSATASSVSHSSLTEKIAKFKRGDWGEIPMVIGAMPPIEDEQEWGKLVEPSDTKTQPASQPNDPVRVWPFLPHPTSAQHALGELQDDAMSPPRKRILRETQFSAWKQQPVSKQLRTAAHQGTCHGKHRHSNENGALSCIINASRELREKKKQHDREQASLMEPSCPHDPWFDQQNVASRQSQPDLQNRGNAKTWMGERFQQLRACGEERDCAPFMSEPVLEAYSVDDLLAVLDTDG